MTLLPFALPAPRLRTLGFSAAVLASFAAFSLSGCGNSPVASAHLDRDRDFLETPLTSLRADDRQTDLLPLAPGDYWQLRTVTRGQRFSDRIAVGATNFKVPGVAQPCTVLEITRDGKPWRREVYVPDSHAVLMAAAKDETSPMMTFSPPIPLLRAPFTEGQAWSWRGDIHLDNKTYPGKAYSRLSSVEPVTTAAGRFRAYRIDTVLLLESGTEEIRFPSVRWLAPGVGWVRRGFADQGQPAFSELQEFHVR